MAMVLTSASTQSRSCRSLASDLMLLQNTAALVDLSSTMLIAVETRCHEVGYGISAAVALWLAMLNGRPSRAIVRKRALTVATTIVLLAGKPPPQSLRAFTVQCHRGPDYFRPVNVRFPPKTDISGYVCFRPKADISNYGASASSSEAHKLPLLLPIQRHGAMEDRPAV